MTEYKDNTRANTNHCCHTHGCKYSKANSTQSASPMEWITDIRAGETDILVGTTGQPLQLKSIEGVILLALTRPGQPWTHDYLCSLPLDQLIGVEALNYGVSAYIGSNFVGSTEV